MGYNLESNSQFVEGKFNNNCIIQYTKNFKEFRIKIIKLKKFFLKLKRRALMREQEGVGGYLKQKGKNRLVIKL